MMPVLVVLAIVIAGYGVTREGAIEGVKYYLLPDFSKFSLMTVVAAMGQLFYSMSLAMGIMITYGSYMKKEISIEKSVHQIEIFDTGVAFLAGLMIIPAVFAFSGAENINKGAGLMFMTLPKVFDKMPGGAIIGLLFFIMVLFAALTSSISLMETVVSFVCDRTKLNRKLACLLVFLLCIVLGIPSALGNGVTGVWDSVKLLGFSFLDFFDFISNSVLMPIVALLTCIFVGYVIKPKALIEEAEISGKFSGKRLFTVVIRYIAPICIILILGFSVLEALGYVKV
jgi:NSS family neurotransmitter:Na+ symporter